MGIRILSSCQSWFTYVGRVPFAPNVGCGTQMPDACSAFHERSASCCFLLVLFSHFSFVFSVIIIIRMASFCGKFTKQAVSSCFTHYWRETVSLHFNHCSGCSNNHRRSNTIGQILNDHGPNSFISVESSTAPLDSPLALRLRGLFAAVSTTERSPTQEFQRPTCPSAPEVAHRG